MFTIPTILAITSFLLATVALCRAFLRLRRTTLFVAWVTAVVMLGGWLGVWLVTSEMAESAAGHLWYAVALLAICPPVAVLGARRPISNVWPWFVLVPLVAVFGLPSLTVLRWDGPSTPVELQTPTLLGLGLVLVMGVGNYVSTRHTIPALFYGFAVVSLILPASPWGIPFGWSPGDCRSAGIVSLGLAALAVLVTTRKKREAKPTSTAACDQLWRDFRDTYGLVWAKRVMERINWTAREEKWPAALDLAGLHWASDNVDDELRKHTLFRLEQTFRWLLKRFVDDVWIDRRISR